jgi:hypothetical protein
MAFVNQDDNRNVVIPYLTQHEYNLIQFCLGDMMRQFDKKSGSLHMWGFTRTDVVLLLRKMGVTVDLSPEGERARRDMRGLREVVLGECRDCRHSRFSHNISKRMINMDPSLNNPMSFREEIEGSECLMPGCG